MTIRCPGCHAEQQRPASAERPLCMRCGESLASVMGTSAAAVPPPAQAGDFSARTMSMVRPSLANVDSLPALSELVAQAAADVQSAPPQAPQAQSKQWHVRTGAGAQFGPLTADEVHRWMAEGRLDAATIAWRPGQPDWQPLAQAMGTPPPPAIAPPAARDTRIEESPGAVRVQHDSFLAPAESHDAESTSVSSRPTVMHRAPTSRWRVVAAGVAAAAVILGLGGFLLSKSMRATDAGKTAVVSDVPTPPAAAPGAAPAAPAPAAKAKDEPTADDAQARDSKEADASDDAAIIKEKKRHGTKARGHKRRAHRRAPMDE